MAADLPNYHALPADDGYKSSLKPTALGRGHHAEFLLAGALGNKGTGILEKVLMEDAVDGEYRLRIEGLLGEFANPSVKMSVNLRVSWNCTLSSCTKRFKSGKKKVQHQSTNRPTFCC